MRKETKKAPTIRFRGFTDDWEQRKLGDCFAERRENMPDGELLSVTINDGIKKFSELGRHDNSNDDKSKYKRVCIGDIAYNSMRMWQGASGYSIYEGIVSPAYTVLKSKSNINSRFASYLFKCQEMMYTFQVNSQGITSDNWNLKFPALSQIKVKLPCQIYEQKKVADYLSNLDGFVVLHQRKLDQLKKLKKYFLQNMFPAKGEKVPRIRFKGFTGDWEQRKLGELVIIERGGSPRPIDAYITEAQDGLNWVKIGDAPEQGRYITHTKEKIKPSGLSKTRQVFPGDLILSNSMSFGKPYIMGITGCIHDGWLLIRNNQNVFDLKFLCQMLGTKQMLVQYRRLAAGSTVNNLNKELVANAIVKVPETTEQEQIGAFLENLDNVITLHQRKLNQLLTMKKFMLQNLFI